MRTVEQIAQALDDFYYQQDPYGYFDDVDTRTDGLHRVTKLISKSDGTRQAQYDVANVSAEDPFNMTLNDLLKDLIELAEEQEKTRKTIKVVLVKVNELPIVIEIEDNIKILQDLVGGYIETVCIGENMMIICNEEGKLRNLPGNRRVGRDIIAGDFFVTARDDEGDLVSLTEAQERKALSMFAKPENYTGLNMEEEIFITFKLL